MKKNYLLALILLLVGSFGSFVLASDFTLTSNDPSISIESNNEMYSIYLISGTDISSTFEVSQSKEISEGNSKELLGLTVNVFSADETNLNLFADIIIDEFEEPNADGLEFSFLLDFLLISVL